MWNILTHVVRFSAVDSNKFKMSSLLNDVAAVAAAAANFTISNSLMLNLSILYECFEGCKAALCTNTSSNKNHWLNGRLLFAQF